MFDLKLTGIDDVLTRSERATKSFVDAFHAAMFVVAGDILSELLPGVPFKTGALRDSRWIPRAAPTAIEFSAPHAASAHELGSKKKFLQRAVSEASGSVTDRVAALVPRFAASNTTVSTAPTSHPTRPSGGGRARPRLPARRLR
jgi:hypothetical protein